MGNQVIAWVKENKEKLLNLFGVLLVGVLAFEAGLMKGEATQVKPLVLSIPTVSDSSQENSSKSESVQGEKGVRTIAEPVVATIKGNCVFVGSRNSNKYHLPTCAPAKRIKPENRVCFSSKEDAEKRGYVPGCLR